MAEKKRQRPNARFAAAGDEKEPTESERFWEAQRDARGAPNSASASASGTPGAVPISEQVAPPPEKPKANDLPSSATEEAIRVRMGEEEVVNDMSDLLMMPFSQRKKALKALRRRWHPDKNPDRLEVATRIFQFIQSHDAWLAYQGLD